MRKRFAGVWVCLLVLAMGAVARAAEEARWFEQELQFTQDGQRLVSTLYFPSDGSTAAGRQAVVSWDVKSGKKLGQAVLPEMQSGLFARIMLSPGGKLLARTSYTLPHRVTDSIFHTATGKVACVLEKKPTQDVVPLAFSADSKLLVGADLDLGRRSSGKLLAWDTRSGKQVSLFNNLEDNQSLHFAEFSRDNRLLALIFEDMREPSPKRRVVLADRRSGRKLWETTSSEPVQAVSLSRDGKYLAMVMPGTTTRPFLRRINLWDAATGQFLKMFSFAPKTHNGSLRVAFSDDNRSLAAYRTPYYNFSSSHELHVWNIASGQHEQNRIYAEDGDDDDDDSVSFMTTFTANRWLFAQSIGKTRIVLKAVGSETVVRELKLEWDDKLTSK